MKTVIILVTLALTLSGALAAEQTSNEIPAIVTLDGRRFSRGKVSRVEGQEAIVIHSKGIARVGVDLLPDDVRASLGLPTRARLEQEKQFEQEQTAKGLVKRGKDWITKEEDAKREVEYQDLRKKLKRQEAKTVREVETDQISFLDKRVVLLGSIDVDNYFNWGYADSDKFYSFRIRDDTGVAHVYRERYRYSSDALRDELLKAKGALRGSFTIRITSERFDKDSSELMAELVDYGAPVD